jgi:hypothetical protein
MKVLALAVLSALLGGTIAAKADDIYTRYFGGADGGKPCYARYYGDAHLKAHRKQTVRRIEIDFDAAWREDEGGKNRAGDFLAGIGFMLKRSPEWYGQELYCKTLADHFECNLDADGGSLRLIPHGDALRMEVVGGSGSNIHTEGEKDFGEFGNVGSDDRVFILPRVERKLCDAAKPK